MSWKEQVSWPAFRVTEPSGLIVICTDASQLQTSRFLGVKDLQALKTMYLVDSSTTKFILERPRFVAGRPGALKRVLLALVNPRVEIEYDEVRNVGQVKLQELKQALVKNFQSYPDYWMEMDIGSPRAFVEKIEGAEGIAALLTICGQPPGQ